MHIVSSQHLHKTLQNQLQLLRLHVCAPLYYKQSRFYAHIETGMDMFSVLMQHSGVAISDRAGGREHVKTAQHHKSFGPKKVRKVKIPSSHFFLSVI